MHRLGDVSERGAVDGVVAGVEGVEHPGDSAGRGAASNGCGPVGSEAANAPDRS